MLIVLLGLMVKQMLAETDMKFLKESNYVETLPQHIREWLNNQPIWHDRDMFCIFLAGVIFGLIAGGILWM